MRSDYAELVLQVESELKIIRRDGLTSTSLGRCRVLRHAYRDPGALAKDIRDLIQERGGLLSYLSAVFDPPTALEHEDLSVRRKVLARETFGISSRTLIRKEDSAMRVLAQDLLLIIRAQPNAEKRLKSMGFKLSGAPKTPPWDIPSGAVRQPPQTEDVNRDHDEPNQPGAQETRTRITVPNPEDIAAATEANIRVSLRSSGSSDPEGLVNMYSQQLRELEAEIADLKAQLKKKDQVIARFKALLDEIQ